ncbi:462_t:CDS:2 [Ambispora leptoticha]|uniref:462_t:CDS:1 n=1 Tax=Ambispora leptoticha TaxID=144679 RepID=A0A9N9AYX5_9GLOM|nr:462_t:CDS:2 [Ambispora leptoticha]
MSSTKLPLAASFPEPILPLPYSIRFYEMQSMQILPASNHLRVSNRYEQKYLNVKFIISIN